MTTITQDLDMEWWKRFATAVLRTFHPGYVMALFLGILYFAIDTSQVNPVLDWLQMRIFLGTGVSIPKEAWQAAFLTGAITITWFKPDPRFVLLLSIPAGILGGGCIWYGLSTGLLDPVAMAFLIFAYIGIGTTMTMMIFLSDEMNENQELRAKLKEMEISHGVGDHATS